MSGMKPAFFPVILACALLFVASAPAFTAEAPPRTAALPDLSWLPPDDTFDWIQLKSGEWLKGKIKALQERELIFDSSELDYRTFDWDDIRQLRTANVVEIGLIDGQIQSGRFMVSPTEVRDMNDPGRSWPRSQLLALTPAGKSERSYWSGDISLSLALRSGNVEEVDINNYAHLQRRTPNTRVLLDYSGNYSKARDEVNSDDWRVSARLDTWLTNRLYIVLPAGEYYSDPLQNIGDRVTLAAGLAYDIVDSKNLLWTVTAGPGYQWMRFTSVQPGELQKREGVAAGISTRLEWDVTKDIDVDFEYKGQFASKSAGDSTHHAMVKLGIDLTKKLEVDLSLTWDRTVNPEQTAAGIEPDPDDLRLSFGLGFEF